MNPTKPAAFPDIRNIVYTSLFTALMIVGSYIAIPIPFSPVPLILANFFVLLSGLILDMKWACTSAALYLFLGMIGLPVFSGGSGGIVHFIGPTGGYLIGYLAAAFTVSLIARSGKFSMARDLIALIAGFLVIYMLGVPWLKIKLAFTWNKALTAGVLPFLIGDIVKIVAALGLAPILRRIIHSSQQIDK